MKTFKRTCIKDFEVILPDKDSFELEKGKKYITSDIIKDKVVVFASFWFGVPAEHFDNGVVFTEE